jgi:hypothetical protein
MNFKLQIINNLSVHFSLVYVTWIHPSSMYSSITAYCRVSLFRKMTESFVLHRTDILTPHLLRELNWFIPEMEKVYVKLQVVVISTLVARNLKVTQIPLHHTPCTRRWFHVMSWSTAQAKPNKLVRRPCNEKEKRLLDTCFPVYPIPCYFKSV